MAIAMSRSRLKAEISLSIGEIPFMLVPAQGEDEATASKAESDEVVYADLYAQVEPGGNDPLSVPVTDGIVWYGTWEDAIAVGKLV